MPSTTYKNIRHGQVITLDPETISAINEAAAYRHAIDASDTRGAGTCYRFHAKGCVGEGAVQQAAGMKVSIPCLDTVDVDVDIPLLRTEVKTGLPLEKRSKLKLNVVYVVVNPIGELASLLDSLSDAIAEPLSSVCELQVQVSAIATGADTHRRMESVPRWWENRPGTRGSNYRIPMSRRSILCALRSLDIGIRS